MRVNRKGSTGSMVHRIDVQTATTDETSGQPIRTWATTFSKEPAAWTPTAGTESIRGRQVEAGIAGYFTVGYRDGYDTEQRVLHDGQFYGIVYAKPIDGGRRYIELHVRGLPNG
jgi:SPP1 family predicted phage head-tail adaptor